MDDEIIGEFLVECFEGLDRIEQGLVVLEEAPDDTPTLTEVFRILHTIKGTCGFLDFGQLEKVAHRGENLLSLLRDSVIEIDQHIIDALLATNDAIRAILETIEATGTEGDHDNEALLATLEALSEQGTLVTEGQPAAATDASGTASAPEHAAAVDAPAEIDVESETGAASRDGIADADADADTDAVNDDLDVESSLTPDAASVVAAEAAVAEGSDDAADSIDANSARLGDMLVDDGVAQRDDVELAAAEQSLGDERKIGKILVDEGRAEKPEVEATAARQRGAADSSVRVDVSVLDSLMNLVGELVLSRNQIVQLANGGDHSDFAKPAQRLNLLTSELQESVMKTRMQPIGGIWNKLPRVVRDLSNQFGKQIRLEMEGKETELDRTLLEAIKDPLTHMIRNTVDHGIESPETRAAAGKNPEGVLRLVASHEGGQVKIEIIDDGGGIDADAIRSAAVAKGVVTAEQAAAMSDQAAVGLIFRPGFSTAKQVSNVSGRGVGMDVVRTHNERIGGTVEVKTLVGKGTHFEIIIPLTLAIIPAIVVRCDDQRYAIPQPSIQELVRLDDNQRIEEVHGTPVYRLRQRLLPIVDLRSQLGAEPLDEGISGNIVVLDVAGRPFGLVVDAIDDTEEIVIKPLGRNVRDTVLFSGATVMGDGSVALILDVGGVASASGIMNSAAADAALEEELHHADTGAFDDRTVLVVGLQGGERVAVLLDQIDRLEEFRHEQIERSNHREVVQYRGEIMTLIDLGPRSGRGGPSIGASERLSVVVCSVEGSSVGIAVNDVIDIVSQPELRRDSNGVIETAVINGEVVDVMDVVDLAMGGVGEFRSPMLVGGAA
ncbi:MAG: chemotaxis protein CheW [Actinomycetota bacterium]